LTFPWGRLEVEGEPEPYQFVEKHSTAM
jgi:hypothetical protein